MVKQVQERSLARLNLAEAVSRQNKLSVASRAAFFLIMFMLAAGFSSYAQPNVAKDGGTSGSTFALGSTSARKTQLLYLPSDLTGAFSGNVGKIFFRYNTTTGNTLTDFTVKMGQTSNTGFSPSTTFYTGLTTVLSEPSYTIPAGNAGDWFEIPLTTTFSYDATQTLIVELEFTASATTGFSTRSSTKSGQKLYSSSVGATTGTATTTWQDFGMQVAAAGTDVTFASLSAGTTTGCLTATETVEATLTNTGSNTIDFSATPATITAAATGANPITFAPVTVNTGTLAPFASRTVVVSNNYNMTTYGNYTFDATVSLTGDVNSANDTAATLNVTNITPATLPVTVDFTGYTGANLATVFPNWREGDGDTTPDGTSSSWTDDDFANNSSSINGAAARTNFDGTTDTEWIVGPKITPTAGTKLRFDLALTESGNSNAATLGSDDQFQVMVSTNCGNSYTAIRTYTSATPISNTGQTELVDLSAYAGQDIIVAFFANEGTVNDPEDVDLFIDNIFIGTPPSLDLATTALVSPVSGGCFGNAEPVVVTIENAATTAVDFATDPVTVTVVVGGAATQTFTVTVNTGTLAPGATRNVTLGNLNMSATGNYTFDATVSASGDGNAANNALPTVTINNTIISTFPHTEDFESFSTATNATGYANGWSATPSGTTSSYRWNIDTGTTPSSGTGPNADHTLGTSSGKYVFTEASSGSAGDSAILESPCIDLSSLTAPGMEFWYHMFGGDMGDLHVDVWNGTQWNRSVLVISGEQQTSTSAPWQKAKVNLMAYTGSTIKVRFRGINGVGFESDMAVDDVKFYNIPPTDASLTAFVSPVTSGCYGAGEPVTVTIKNEGSTPLTSVPVTVAISGAATQTLNGTFTGTIAPGSSVNFTVGTLNMSAAGTYSFVGYPTVTGDADAANDTIRMTITSTTVSTFPYLEDFESFSTGTNATGYGNGWVATPSGTTSSFRWNIDTNGTPSSDTGPAVDHTLGTSSGKYVFTEASSGSTGDVAILESPCINLSSLTTPGVEFWYHMFGGDMGDLHVDIFNGTQWDSSVFVLSGQQQASDTEAWKKARINLATYTGSTIKVRFRGIRGADFEGDMAIDDVRFFDIPAADLELVKVLLPASGCGLTNQETISAVISNVGSASQSNFPVNFTINSSAPVSVSYTGTLAAGATDTLVLTTTADFSSVGNYAVTVYTALAGDANTANDTISNMTVTNVTTVSVFPYVEDFESGASGWSAGGANSTWALGTPAGPVIDTAASGTNAWVTNLTGNYNSNEASFVESPCFDMSSVNNPVVSLKIWWQTENSFDGALLQATTNNGATWQTIGALNDPNNWYNDNSISGLDWTGGQTGWTGRNNSTNTTGSGGWVTARHTLPTLANQSTVRFRIAFGSDGSVQDDGFAFDDFKVIETPTVNLGNDTTVCGGITLNAGNPGATYAWNTGATTQTVLADTSGTYVVTITDVNGLTATDSVTVTVNAVPVVALGNDTTICAGSAIVLNAGNPGATYMWSDNSTAQTLTVTTAGTYWVDVTNGNSCTTRDSVVVSVASLPTVNLGTDITQCGGTVTLDAGNAGATYLWSTGATTQTVTVSATGTYMVTVTNASGCSNTDTISVTINSAPVVNLGNDTTICAGTTLTLDAGNAGATYLWSNNSTAQTLAVTTAGTYWVDVTANGCTTRDSVVVSVNPLPIASFTMVQTGMGVAFTNTGSTGAGVTYAWDFGDNSTSTQQNPTHTYTSVGSYTIRLIVTNSCGSDTTTQNITIVGVKNALAGKSVAVYPNPTTGMAEIELKGYKGEVSLLLYNTTGQQVQAQQFTATNDLVRQPINLTGMPSGVYILRTISEGQMQFHKIILE